MQDGSNGKHGKALRLSDIGGGFTSLILTVSEKDLGSFFSKYAWQNEQFTSQTSVHEISRIAVK